MPIKLNTASGGGVILTGANTASDKTITVPAVDGTMLTTASTFAGTGPAFRAYMANAQTISGNTFTKLNFNTEVFDTNSCYDTSTYRFTPNVAGYYQITSNTYFTATAQLYIHKNGNSDVTGPYLNAVGHTVAGLVYLNGTTDFVEIYYYGNSGVTTSNNAASANIFCGALVRAA